MISYGLLSTLTDNFLVVDFNVFFVNLIIAVVLVIAGLFLGKFVKIIARKMISQSGVSRTAKKSFVDLFLTVIQWSIYLLFIVWALDQLGIPQLTSWLTSILVVVPALFGSFLLIGVGFALAVYLRDLISETDLLDKKVLSMILFYFILYIFMIFAIKTALISQDKSTVNNIIVVLTAVVSAALAYIYVKKK